MQGVWVANERGGRKSGHDDGYDRVTGLTTIFRCVTFDALFLGEKYGEDMMLIWYKTNLGVGNTRYGASLGGAKTLKLLHFTVFTRKHLNWSLLANFHVSMHDVNQVLSC